MSIRRGRNRAQLMQQSALLLLFAVSVPAVADEPLPSETPSTFVPRVESFDYIKREAMIPMRDGVKLQTVILVPRGARAFLAPASPAGWARPGLCRARSTGS